MSHPFLSVVIPAFNEERRISTTLDRIVGFLASQPYQWEIIVADDGSFDKTGELVSQYVSREPRIHLLRLLHGGKGWAVKCGMLAAHGRYRFMCDADLSMPIEQLPRFLPPNAHDYDIAIGSREAPGARRVGEPFMRRIMAKVFAGVVRLLVLNCVSDTQCGFKCFEGSTAENLFPTLRLRGFTFDVELLVIARKRGLKVIEVPIDWFYSCESKVRPLRDAVHMLADLTTIVRLRFHRNI